jgi:hypothetical protein
MDAAILVTDHEASIVANFQKPISGTFDHTIDL